MQLNVFGIFDRIAGFYSAPFFMASAGEARRAFIDLCRDFNTAVGRHPEDYQLLLLGSFDNETGRFELLMVPEFLLAGQAAMAPAPLNPPSES